MINSTKWLKNNPSVPCNPEQLEAELEEFRSVEEVLANNESMT